MYSVAGLCGWPVCVRACVRARARARACVCVCVCVCFCFFYCAAWNALTLTTGWFSCAFLYSFFCLFSSSSPPLNCLHLIIYVCIRPFVSFSVFLPSVYVWNSLDTTNALDWSLKSNITLVWTEKIKLWSLKIIRCWLSRGIGRQSYSAN